MIAKPLFTITLLLAAATCAITATAATPMAKIDCQTLLTATGLQASMLRPDPPASPIQRRIKILTTGERADAVETMDVADVKIDTADPSLVMPITYPNGRTKYRINFSGMRYIEANHPEDFFRGGILQVKHSRGFYADGTEMTGPYHGASWPWDVVIYQNDKGENIALGGVMKQPAPGLLPNVADHNPTRSRWWGKVEYQQRSNGTYEERIIWQAPLHDFNQAEHAGWVRHGYGGTLLTKFNPRSGLHEPVRSRNGNFYLFYERVIEEKDGKPWVTTMFVREIDPSLKFTLGPETLVTDVISAKTGLPYRATRRGSNERIDGYLAEGGNVLIDLQNGSAIKAFSGNDYVAKYGIYLDYLPPGGNLQSKFIPVTDEHGELIDFAATMNLREILHATWLGRPQLEYAPDGKLWMRFHFVPIGSIPKGGPIEGWPSAEQFVEYGRITAQAPVKIVYDPQGRPSLELDLDPSVHQ